MGIKSSDAFPSKWLTSAEIGSARVRCVIQEVRLESIVENEDEKPVAYFEGKNKGMVINRTNWGNLSMDFGDDSDLWLGKPVEIYAERKMFKGKPVMGLTIRASGNPVQHNAPRAPLPSRGDPRPEPPQADRSSFTGGTRPDIDDEIPF